VISEASLVADPYLVNLFVLPRHDALDDDFPVRFGLAAGVERDIASDGTLSANRSRSLEFPRTRAEAEVRGGQRADRTDVAGVARENGIKPGLRERDNLGGTATLIKADDRFAGDVSLEADTTSALDTAFAVQPDQFAQRDVFGKALFLI
jgi:hypothetical protein